MTPSPQHKNLTASSAKNAEPTGRLLFSWLRPHAKDRFEIRQRIEQEERERIALMRQRHRIDYDPVKPTSFTDIAKYAKKLKYDFNTDKALLIHMELTNGDHTHAIVYPVKERFVWNEKTYLVDHSFKYYVHSAKMYCLDYHEDFTLPIRRRIPVDLLRKALSGQGITDVENATNPSTLKRFIESEIIEKVMKGQEFEDALKFIKFMVIVGTVVGVIHLITFVIKSGMLQSIKLW